MAESNSGYDVYNPEGMLGRRTIYTDATEITHDNLIKELTDALYVHRQNRAEIQYLWNYYRGRQDILDKVKKIRPEICNKIVCNRANEIVSFKVGYLAGEPIQYVSRREDEKVMKNVNLINDAMYILGKHTADKNLIEWDMICGTAYRFIAQEPIDDVPFRLYTLDPRNTFVVYSSNIKHEPMFSVSYYMKEGDVVQAPMVGVSTYQREVYEIYTKYHYFKVEDGNIVESKEHYLGAIPVIEYPANTAKQGSFEVVLPLLNALNAVYSDRLDSVDAFVQSFMKFVNCSLDEGDLSRIKEYGAIEIKSDNNLPADVELISDEMDQQQTQTLADSIDMMITIICGLPNRSGGIGSTSDTGRASELRDGWVTAEVKAKESENSFTEAETKALRVIFNICKNNHYCDLTVKDIKLQFTRRNYDNIQSKSQVLIAMLQNNKVHPKLAFTSSGLFTDPEAAYAMSMKYWEEYQEKELEKMSIPAKTPNDTEQGSSQNAKQKSNPISNPILKSASETDH